MPIPGSAPQAEPALAREGQHGEHGEAAAQQEGQAEIDRGADDIDLERAEILRLDAAAEGGQLLGADRRGDAGRQHEHDELPGKGGIDALERLADDDVAEDLRRRQAERGGRLDLAAMDALDPGAHDLGGIGAVVEDQRQHRRFRRRQAQTEAG